MTKNTLEVKKPTSIYMSAKTKERLDQLADKLHYSLGDTIEFLLDISERTTMNQSDELLATQNQTKKMVSVIEERTELFMVLFNAMTDFMQLEIKEGEEHAAFIEAKELVKKRQESRKTEAINKKKYSQVTGRND
ncbi:hypothetical protein [Enterococcus faecalis]|uniref:hypothetical protein n=1 Tax=Enterococcus faecalis TaxID=1351 RepID=UPI0007105ECD|nr:hypothetical protein [Enterococcus faecalis]EKZ0447617.1 hypothetical protein [Enterococcus faecalis]ELT8936889.1 hypothetical protein [Enterococcus faecalis]KXF69467.1 hypothetical protein AQ486_13735 [Enterococcus faecalis]MBC2813085.1 hypothetical protein [Enterococcus faecalis]